MFTIISIMFIGIGIGYLMRNVQMLQKVEKSASLTILLLLFVLGVSTGWEDSGGRPPYWPH